MSAIPSIYVIVGTGENDKFGIWGIGDNPAEMMPLICGDEKVVPMMVKAAKQIQAATGDKFRVIKYESHKDVTLEFVGSEKVN